MTYTMTVKAFRIMSKIRICKNNEQQLQGTINRYNSDQDHKLQTPNSNEVPSLDEPRIWNHVPRPIHYPPCLVPPRCYIALVSINTYIVKSETNRRQWRPRSPPSKQQFLKQYSNVRGHHWFTLKIWTNRLFSHFTRVIPYRNFVGKKYHAVSQASSGRLFIYYFRPLSVYKI